MSIQRQYIDNARLDISQRTGIDVPLCVLTEAAFVLAYECYRDELAKVAVKIVQRNKPSSPPLAQRIKIEP